MLQLTLASSLTESKVKKYIYGNNGKMFAAKKISAALKSTPSKSILKDPNAKKENSPVKRVVVNEKLNNFFDLERNSDKKEVDNHHTHHTHHVHDNKNDYDHENEPLRTLFEQNSNFRNVETNVRTERKNEDTYLSVSTILESDQKPKP